MSLVKTVTIRGKELEIHIDGHGIFNVNMNGGPLRGDSDNELSAQTLKELLDKVDRQLKLSGPKYSIPFVRWNEGSSSWRGKPDKPGLRRGVVIGVHAGTDNVLVRWEDIGKSEQDSGYGSSQLYLRLTSTQEKAYLRLKQQIADAEQAIEEIEKKCRIDLTKEMGDLRTRK